MIDKKAFIGVDPGKTGFITVFVDGEYIFYPMPTHKVESGKFNRNGTPKMKEVFWEEGLPYLYEEIKYQLKSYLVSAAIEDVIGREGWSAQNNFNFGGITKQLKLMLLMLHPVSIIEVRPQKWQSVMYQGIEKIKMPSSTGKTMINDTKAMSAKVAQMLEPDIIFSKQAVRKKDGTTHKIDDNKTDSFLICRYLYLQSLN